jgi:hypothetical protein
MPEVRTDAAAALVAGGEAALSLLQSTFRQSGQHRDLQMSIVRIYCRIGGERALALLSEQLSVADGQVRQHVLKALRQCGYRAQGQAAAIVEQQLQMEIGHAAWTLAALLDLGAGEPVALLTAAFHQRLERLRERVWLLLSFLYDPPSILRARENLAHASSDKRAYALEALDILLAPKLKPVVLPLFEDLALAQRLQRFSAVFPQPRLDRIKRLSEIIAGPAAPPHPWITSCALYTIVRLTASECIEVVGRARSAPDPLVRETATWTFAWLDRAQYGDAQHNGGARLSTIEKVIVLKAVTIFAETPDDVLAAVAAILEEVEVEAGERIFEKGEIGRCMYVIADGRVRVHDGDRTLNLLGERDVFGEMAVLDAAPRVASATAVEDTRLFRLDQDALYELMADHVEVARGIIRVLSRYVRERVHDLAEAHTRLQELTAARAKE